MAPWYFNYNTTIDIRTNTIQRRRESDYTSKMSTITVPDYALPAPQTSQEPPEAQKERERVWNIPWIISKPDEAGKAHYLDRRYLFGGQGKRIFFFARDPPPPHPMRKLLAGKRIAMTVFLYSPMLA